MRGVVAFVFNIAKGRVAELYNRVKTNDPANSALVVVAIARGAATDSILKTYETLVDLLADASVAEVTNTGYARKVLTDADLAPIAADHVNGKMVLDAADQTWEEVLAGGSWTDIVICYDPDTTTGTDANLVPLVSGPFAITPENNRITLQIANFFEAV